MKKFIYIFLFFCFCFSVFYPFPYENNKRFFENSLYLRIKQSLSERILV